MAICQWLCIFLANSSFKSVNQILPIGKVYSLQHFIDASSRVCVVSVHMLWTTSLHSLFVSCLNSDCVGLLLTS